MDPRLPAGAIAAGRVAFGVGLIAAPDRLARRWVGAAADEEAVGVITRGLGGRDVLLGAIALHTVGHPQVGPRMQLACALGDATDLLASLAARRALPASGVAGTVALAGGAVVAQVLVARALREA